MSDDEGCSGSGRPVGRYHLHGRLVVGPLGAFTRNETRAAVAGSWTEAQAVAREMQDAGFTVWISERGARSTGNGHGEMR